MNDSNRPYQDLLSHRVIKLFGKITQQLTAELRDVLLRLDAEAQKEITLLIDSTGGETADALQLHTLIQVLRSDVLGLVLGECSSASLLVLQACTSRLASTHSTFLIHSGTATRPFRIDDNCEATLKVWFEEKQRQDRNMAGILLSRAKMNAEHLQELKRQGDNAQVCFGSGEALRLGLIDLIVDERYKLFNQTKRAGP